MDKQPLNGTTKTHLWLGFYFLSLVAFVAFLVVDFSYGGCSLFKDNRGLTPKIYVYSYVSGKFHNGDDPQKLLFIPYDTKFLFLGTYDDVRVYPSDLTNTIQIVGKDGGLFANLYPKSSYFVTSVPLDSKLLEEPVPVEKK